MGICQSQKKSNQIPEQSNLPQSTAQIPPIKLNYVKSEQVLLAPTQNKLQNQVTSLQLISKIKITESSPIRTKKKELKISYSPLSQFYTLVKLDQLVYAHSQIVQHNISGIYRRLRILNKIDEDSRNLIEWLILNQLDHPKISSIMDIVMDKTKIYIIEELCLEGQLYEAFAEGQVSEVIVGNITHQILLALQYCEEKGFIHNRLNIHSFHLQNSALDFIVKLVDYKNLYQQERIDSENIYYIAPEVLSKTPKISHQQADIWSLGIIIYYLLKKSRPYQLKNNMTLEEKKQAIIEQSKDIDIQNFTLLSKEGQRFLKSLLEFEPEKRPTIQDCLNSNWLRKTLQSDQKFTKALYSLTKAKPMNYLQQCLLVQMVTNYEPEMKIEIEELFQHLCKKQKGVINRQELLAFFEKVFPQAKDNQQLVSQVFKHLDTDKSGGLNENEFLIGAVDWAYLLRDSILQDTFNQLSLGGYISYKSLSKRIQADENLLKEQFEIQERINFKNFKNLLKFENS